MKKKLQPAAARETESQAERATFLKEACAVDTAFQTRDEALLLLALDESLRRLSVTDKTKAELVHLRFFEGLTLDEAARALGISRPKAERYWAYARAWLHQDINSDNQGCLGGDSRQANSRRG